MISISVVDDSRFIAAEIHRDLNKAHSWTCCLRLDAVVDDPSLIGCLQYYLIL
jgi:hypothetical protein